MPQGSLENKRIVIIGGSSCIGFAVAEVCLKAGPVSLVIVSSDARLVETSVHSLKQVVTNIEGNRIRGYTLNGNDAEALKNVAINMGDIDHVVWASSQGISLNFLDNVVEETTSFLDAEIFWGPMAIAQNAKFRAGGSLLITIGSFELESNKACDAAAAIMGAVDTVTRSFAVDLAPVRVNLICAGLVKTELWKGIPPSAMGETKEVNEEDTAERLPIQSMVGTEEIVQAHVFIMKSTCITGTAYFTGQKIEIDGGNT